MGEPQGVGPGLKAEEGGEDDAYGRERHHGLHGEACRGGGSRKQGGQAGLHGVCQHAGEKWSGQGERRERMMQGPQLWQRRQLAALGQSPHARECHEDACGAERGPE